MNIRQINEAIEQLLDKEDIIKDGLEVLKHLKGKYFEPVYNDEIFNKEEYDRNIKERKLIFGDYFSTFDNWKEDRFTLDMLAEWHHYIAKNNYVEHKDKGYSFECAHIADFDDMETIKGGYTWGIKHREETIHYMMPTLCIDINKFNGDFKELKADFDDYMLQFKNAYDKIKNNRNYYVRRKY